jgi:hypothetical protein
MSLARSADLTHRSKKARRGARFFIDRQPRANRFEQGQLRRESSCYCNSVAIYFD